MCVCVCVCVRARVRARARARGEGGCSFGKPDEFLERTKKIKVVSIRTQLHINNTEMMK